GDIILGDGPGVGDPRGRGRPFGAAARSGDGDLATAVVVCHAGRNPLGAWHSGRCGPHGIAQHMTGGCSSGTANPGRRLGGPSGPAGQDIPVVEADRDRGSRGCQEPRATLARKVSTARLKTSGSSRLAVWPVRGRTARPAVGMVRLSISAGSRQPSSSSPTRISTGTAIRASSPVSAYSEGRAAWTPRMVSALPSEEWPARASANSAQPRGFLFWNWTRAGPTAYRSATLAAPSAAKAAPVSTDSERKASARSGSAP